MFFAHLPSGYILSKYISDKVGIISGSNRAVLFAGIVGAVSPDIDLAYFYLIDNCATHHHKYISHWPVLWLSFTLVSFLWLCLSTNKKKAFLAVVFSLGGVLHMLLDSVVGDIWWFAPVIDKPYSLFTVKALYQPWWLNFILNWSFALELVISVWAVVLLRSETESEYGRSKIFQER
jgi:inner membrane protein